MRLRTGVAVSIVLVSLVATGPGNAFPESIGNPAPWASLLQTPGKTSPVQLLRTFRTVFVRSGTIYLKTELMRSALEQQPEFNIWSLATASKPDEAEVVIEITRPFMTFDWHYELSDQKTGMALGSGKVVAWDGRTAAPKLAADLVKVIKNARPMPLEVDPTRTLKTFHTVYVHSDTVYLDAEDLQRSLETSPEFVAWGLSTVKKQESADVAIEITRPFLTFDWKYSLVHQGTSVQKGQPAIRLKGDDFLS